MRLSTPHSDSVAVHVVASGLGFVEGPAVTADGVVCVSIDRGYVYKIRNGEATVLAVTGGGPNGLAVLSDDTLAVAQNGGRPPARRWPEICGGVQVVRANGLVQWLTRDPVSPNDICVGPDGALYLSDPTRNGRRDDGRVWRCDSQTGEAELLASLTWYPNGIAFGTDDALFVASTGERRIVRFAVDARGLGRAETFLELPYGFPDGFAFDAEGNLVVAVVGEEGCHGRIMAFDRDGRLIDTSAPSRSRKLTNVALSADARLFITDADAGAVLSMDWPYAALPLHPFRARVLL